MQWTTLAWLLWAFAILSVSFAGYFLAGLLLAQASASTPSDSTCSDMERSAALSTSYQDREWCEGRSCDDGGCVPAAWKDADYEAVVTFEKTTAPRNHSSECPVSKDSP